MARRASQSALLPPAPRKQRTVAEMQRGIERIKARIATLQAFDPSAMAVEQPPEIAGLQVDIKANLDRIFGEGTADYRHFESACDLQWSPSVMYGDYPALRDYQEGVREKIAYSVAILGQAVRFLEEEIADAAEEQTAPPVRDLSRDFSKVFVVHGHDDGAREAVARFLERLGIKPIILHEQANQGRTVIEKVEAHSGVNFAVVLLTPDDEGCAKDGTPAPRARQNVLLELGYFIGKLGRKHVCALRRGSIEIPSDFVGVVAESFDEAGGWRQKLATELDAAGFSIDWNKVMRA